MFKPNIAPKSQTPGFMVFSSLMLLILSTVVLSLFMNRLQIQGEPELAPTRRIQDLVTLLKQAEGKRSVLEGEVARLRKKMMGLEQQSSSPQLGQNLNDPEIQKLNELAGLTSVTGPGILITLEDSKTAASNGNDEHVDPSSGKIQADDLLKLINELKADGATAISINDQRLVVTSEIVAAGPTILVNQARLTQPIVVKAMGKPDILLNALKIRGGIMEYLDFFNIKVTVRAREELKLPAYKGPIPS